MLLIKSLNRGTGITKGPLREIKQGEKGTGRGDKLGAPRTLLLVAAALLMRGI